MVKGNGAMGQPETSRGESRALLIPEDGYGSLEGLSMCWAV